MPSNTPVPDKAAGDIFSESMWDLYIKENINKLLDRGHRVLTVAQFTALSGPEGTKGTVAPDEVYLEVDATNGVLWHLEYESGETTYKWRFIGGPPLVSEVTAAHAVASASGVFAAFSTPGPSVTAPRSGDFDIEVCGYGASQAATTAQGSSIGISIGGAAPAAQDVATVGGSVTTGNVTVNATVSRASRKNVATGNAIAMHGSDADSTKRSNWSNRAIRVWPVRIRHDG